MDCFVCYCGQFELNPLSDRKPMKIFENRSDPFEFVGVGDDPSQRILDALQFGQLGFTGAHEEGVTVVNATGDKCICEQNTRRLGQETSDSS